MRQACNFERDFVVMEWKENLRGLYTPVQNLFNNFKAGGNHFMPMVLIYSNYTLMFKDRMYSINF